MKKVAAVVFGVGGVALLVVALTRGGSDDSRPNPDPVGCRPEGIISVGEPIPSCSFEKVGGGTFHLSDLAGKPALINFWASWCTFCIDEMPAFQRVYAALGGRVEFIGADLLNVDGETRAAAKTFAAKTGVTYPLIYDEDGLLYGHFTPNLVMPVTIFVGADGRVVLRKFGPYEEKALREAISTHLGVH
jgi:thiol-disulfide isomerase/thioredoxin